MSSTLTAPTATDRRDWTPGLLVGLGVMLTAALVWAYSMLGGTPGTDRPRPIWLGLDKVVSQLSDGRMMAVKVNFELKNVKDSQALQDYQAALTVLVRDVAATLSHDDLRGSEGMKRYGAALHAATNDYLHRQGLPGRVKAVAFEELVLMP